MEENRQQLLDLAMRRAAQLLAQHGVTVTGRPLSTSPQDERRAHALAILRTCREMVTQLERLADDAALQAHRAQASYAEIGAARGISRQAARQAAVRHEQRFQAQQAAMRAARRSAGSDDEWGDLQYQRQLAQEERDERWPPRSWQYRAPTGYRTVAFVDGPAQSHTFRVPVGDDAFPLIDHYRVFGRVHDRYARYAATRPDSDQYYFTGEYFIRWT
ncbi:hypothetical protein ACH5AJ_35285 [Streptomyces rochei]|uniref:hypothetical protein n=1 Tax=Streptomyces rochei TaxID=1928 RepID=UPI0037ACB4B9